MPASDRETVRYRPVGVVRSPWAEPAGTPVQASAARDVEGVVELRPELAPGLRDIEGFSHVILVYHCHRAGPVSLTVTPFLDDRPHGVFATRAPARPNPIGVSVVRLLGVEGATLRVRGLDVLDGTPVLDVKPYVPAFDAPAAERTGWLEGRVERMDEVADDGRFGS